MAKKYGKWIGGALGWTFGGPIGSILGFAIGSMFDSASDAGVYQQIYTSPDSRQRTQEGDFSISLLILSAAVMKADGKVLKSELDYIKVFFTKQFGAAKTKEHLQLLKEVLKQPINVRDVCFQIKHFTEHATRLQLVYFLIGIAKADGHVDERELAVIHQIASYLGIKEPDFQSIKAMFVVDSEAYYTILEIDKKATDEEVKKAYRKMAMKYHPDKISHLGEDAIKGAKEKFQKVQEAYEAIRKQRGMK
jgi:DnaJ like chaperone protein